MVPSAEGEVGGKAGDWHTFAAEEDGEVPEFGHVEGFEDLALIACPIAVETDCCIVLLCVLVCECNAGADGDLCTDDTIAAVEAFGEHVH